MTEAILTALAAIASVAVPIAFWRRPRGPRITTRAGFKPTEHEAAYLEAKRREAIDAAGEKWLLHPSNEVKKKEGRRGR